MKGIARFEVDLAEVPGLLHANGDYDRASVLAFAAGRPIGTLDLELVEGTLSGHAVRAAAESSLAAEIHAAGEIGPNAPSGIDVTVAICTHERPELLLGCLVSLVAQSYAPREILVVDNAPTSERTHEVVAGFAGVRYVREENQGLNFARNRALLECSSEILAFVDDDVVAHTGWLGGIAQAFRDEPHAAAVTGSVVPFRLDHPAEILFERHGGFGRGFRTRRIDRGFFGLPHLVHATGTCGAGCNMAFRRDDLAALEGFDNSLDVGARLPGGGDLDIFSRVIRAGGMIVYEPTALVRHRHRPNRAGLRRQFYNWGRGYTAALTAAFVDEPKERRRVLRAAIWWLLKYQFGQRFIGRLLGRNSTKFHFILIEVIGGFFGPLALFSTRKYIPEVRGVVIVPTRGEFLRKNPFPYPNTIGLFYREKLAAIHALLPSRSPARVLEIGGGRSGLTRMCFPGANIVTLDSDIEELRGMQSTETRVQADAVRLPFADGSFDCVTMFDVIEHLERDDVAAIEAVRVLAPSGLLLVSTPTTGFRYPHYSFTRAALPTESQILAEWGHVRIGYRLDSLSALFPGLDLEDVHHFQNRLSVLSHDIAFARWNIHWRRLCVAMLWPMTFAGMALQSKHRGFMLAARYRKAAA